jgi:hypothetical protein
LDAVQGARWIVTRNGFRLAAFFTVLVVGVTTIGCVPSVSSMKRKFPAHRTSAERLVKMLLEDPQVVTVMEGSIALSPPDMLLFEEYPDRVPQDLWPITLERWKEYRELLREIDLPFGATRCGPSTIAVRVYLRGFLLHGNEAGYVYSEGPFRSNEECPRFRVEHIEGPWFAYNQTF